MTKDEALKMAINVLELYEEKLNSSIAIEVIQACKEALEQPTNMVTIPLDKLEDMQRRLKEQPTQEPVAWMETYKGEPNNLEFTKAKLDGWSENKEIVPLYTHPKEWQGLSDDDINGAVKFLNVRIEYPIMFARLIEMHLKEKNG